MTRRGDFGGEVGKVKIKLSKSLYRGVAYFQFVDNQSYLTQLYSKWWPVKVVQSFNFDRLPFRKAYTHL